MFISAPLLFVCHKIFSAASEAVTYTKLHDGLFSIISQMITPAIDYSRRLDFSSPLLHIFTMRDDVTTLISRTVTHVVHMLIRQSHD